MQPIPASCVQSPHCAHVSRTVPLGQILANVSAGSQLGLCAAQHLLTFLEMKQPGPMFRAFVLLTQGIFFNLYFLCAPGSILLLLCLAITLAPSARKDAASLLQKETSAADCLAEQVVHMQVLLPEPQALPRFCGLPGGGGRQDM